MSHRLLFKHSWGLARSRGCRCSFCSWRGKTYGYGRS